jgi:molybdopterin-guanine dinucleotide biosynthesis protein A
MGRDKATVLVDGATLAARTAGVLVAAELTGPLLEVGPGWSGLPAFPDEAPGSGPLGAVATGVSALRSGGFDGGALVVATDLPRLRSGLLSWLAAHPSPGSVVPLRHQRPQWLCARYSPAELDTAAGLVRSGRSALRELADSSCTHLVGEDELAAAGFRPADLDDVDTPADLARIVGSR